MRQNATDFYKQLLSLLKSSPQDIDCAPAHHSVRTQDVCASRFCSFSTHMRIHHSVQICGHPDFGCAQISTEWYMRKRSFGCAHIWTEWYISLCCDLWASGVSRWHSSDTQLACFCLGVCRGALCAGWLLTLCAGWRLDVTLPVYFSVGHEPIQRAHVSPEFLANLCHPRVGDTTHPDVSSSAGQVCQCWIFQ